MTKSKQTSYDPIDVVSLVDSGEKTQEEMSLISVPIRDSLRKWTRDAGKVPVKARGVYRYGYRGGEHPVLRDDTTSYSLHLVYGKVWGTATDKPGGSTIEGEVDEEKGTVKFLKKYGARNLWAKWEYNGQFTPWGVTGIWHRPGNPASNLRGNGRFIMWLEEDEVLPDITEMLSKVETPSTD